MNTCTIDTVATIDQLPFEQLPNVYMMDTSSEALDLTLPPPSLDDAIIGVINGGTNPVTVIGTLADGSSFSMPTQYQSAFFQCDADAQVWRLVSGNGASSPAVNAQIGTSYTIQASDNGKIVTFDNGSGIDVTVPIDLPVGFNCVCIQLGAGVVTFADDGTSVLNSLDAQLDTAGQYAVVGLVSYVANTFVLSGATA